MPKKKHSRTATTLQTITSWFEQSAWPEIYEALYHAACKGGEESEKIVNFITTHERFVSHDDEDKLYSLILGKIHQKISLFKRYTKSRAEAMALLQEAITMFEQISTSKRDDTYYLNLGECYLDLATCGHLTLDATIIESYYTSAMSQFLNSEARFNEQTDQADFCLTCCDGALEFAAFYLQEKRYEQARHQYLQANRYITRLNPQVVEEYDLEIQNGLLSVVAGQWGFTVQDVDSDGSCFFHAAIAQFNDHSNFQYRHVELRRQTVAHIEANRDDYTSFIGTEDDFVSYVREARLSDTWCDHMMILAFARQFNITVVVVNNDSTPPIIFRQPTPTRVMYFGYRVENHYMALFPDPEITPEKSIAALIESTDIDAWHESKVKTLAPSSSKSQRIAPTIALLEPVAPGIEPAARDVDEEIAERQVPDDEVVSPAAKKHKGHHQVSVAAFSLYRPKYLAESGDSVADETLRAIS